jgi:acetoacetyl-CoA synthetase
VDLTPGAPHKNRLMRAPVALHNGFQAPGVQMSQMLWQPSEERITNTNLARFIQFVNRRSDKQIREYPELYSWSVEAIPDFWETFWEFSQIRTSTRHNTVVDDLARMPGAKWFIGSRLNLAENLLRYRDGRVALIARDETGSRHTMTFAELHDSVARFARSLREMGIVKGDRVAAFMPNILETVVAMLATTSLGAVWSSCSPDFGTRGVLDRFGQIAPRVLLAADGYYYRGRRVDCMESVAGLIDNLTSVERLIVVPYTCEPDLRAIPRATLYRDFLSPGHGLPLEFEQLPFDHPAYIMYSSGTTGLPKCLVHGTGGALIQPLKELILHSDLKREDNIFYFTTCGWMMWNWLISSLAVGATVLLYDGSPFYPEPSTLWKMAEEEKITIFGTSARYIGAIEKDGVSPGRDYDVSRIRTILSTGSPLPAESFRYIYREVKQDVQLSSISGGTDIMGCFALGNPMGPVYEGEIQCRGLGMKVEAFDEAGAPVTGQKGELVCTAAFPSMPVCFWDDLDNTKYLAAYFQKYPGVWTHGDYMEITGTGGAIIYGRSDATLNPGGVRIGTAEIYRQVETLPEIADSIVVGQQWQNDVRVILFVKLAAGQELTEDLKDRIRRAIRENASPRHVPARILAVDDIPYTINSKKVELAVKNVIEGRPVANKDALANPRALELFQNLPELRD